MMVGGDCLVSIINVGYKNFDFSLAMAKNRDLMVFSLDKKIPNLSH